MPDFYTRFSDAHFLRRFEWLSLTCTILYLNMVSAKLKMRLSQVFAILLSLLLGNSDLPKIVLDEVLFRLSFVIIFVSPILKLRLSRLHSWLVCRLLLLLVFLLAFE